MALTKEVLFEDEQDNILWCVRDYIPAPLSTFDGLVLETEPEFTLYGKVCKQRRCVGFYSDTSKGYKYARQMIAAQPFTDEPSVDIAKGIMDEVNKDFGFDFNGILVNRYRTGEDYVSPHGDDERGLSKGAVVSIAYGAVRKFVLYRNKKQIFSVSHEPGMLLCMEGATFQSTLQHAIPREKDVTDERLSLTFRCHVD